jgi:hypothetical protein
MLEAGAAAAHAAGGGDGRAASTIRRLLARTTNVLARMHIGRLSAGRGDTLQTCVYANQARLGGLRQLYLAERSLYA